MKYTYHCQKVVIIMTEICDEMEEKFSLLRVDKKHIPEVVEPHSALGAGTYTVWTT